ncbi:MAG: hypothetical protein M3394_07650 [Actinomycetota bacterium]|nr:hypothetical protein [Actinomycetota bacterium]
MSVPLEPDTSVPAVVLHLGDHGSLGIARSLGRLGVAVHGVSERRTPAARSRWFRTVSPWSGTVAALQSVGHRLGGRPALVPTGDAAALFVDEHADALDAAFRFPRQAPGVARKLASKRGLYELCLEHDVPTPLTVFPQSRDDVATYDGPFPVMVKAVDTAAADQRGVERMVPAFDSAEALAAYDRLEDPVRPNLMLQELIPGGPEQVWMFNGYFDADAECRFAATGRKLRQCPPATGSTSLGQCVPNGDVDHLTRRLMKALGYRGILDCGYRYDPRDGQYKLLDVNPRVGATFRLFVGRGGLDVARALYLDLTGQPIPVDTVAPGRRWLVESNDLVSFARTSELRLIPWLQSLRGVQETAWWATDDPLPFLAMAGATVRRAMARPGPEPAGAPHRRDRRR